MNAGALSNSLFVNNIAAMTQQCSTKSSGPKLRDNEIAEQVDVSSEPREVEAIEQNHSSNSEPIEFKRALEKQSDNQTDVQR